MILWKKQKMSSAQLAVAGAPQRAATCYQDRSSATLWGHRKRLAPRHPYMKSWRSSCWWWSQQDYSQRLTQSPLISWSALCFGRPCRRRSRSVHCELQVSSGILNKNDSALDIFHLGQHTHCVTEVKSRLDVTTDWIWDSYDVGVSSVVHSLNTRVVTG